MSNSNLVDSENSDDDVSSSLRKYVEIINTSPEPWIRAATLVWVTASKTGYTEEEEIESYLDALVESGAKFDHFKALGCALMMRNNRVDVEEIREKTSQEICGNS